MALNMQTLERTLTDKVCNEVNNAVATFKARVYDAILAEMHSLVILRVELVLKSINVSSERDPGSAVLNRDQRDFSENADGFLITASCRLDSNTDLNRIDETRGNITVEANDYSGSE